jgi:hypothetical protein
MRAATYAAPLNHGKSQNSHGLSARESFLLLPVIFAAYNGALVS